MAEKKNIEYGMAVIDKNGKTIGEIDHIVMDAWSGEPRKYIVRLADDVSAVYFRPDDVSAVKGGKVTLGLVMDEMERT